MTNQQLDDYVALLTRAGWKVELVKGGEVQLDEAFRRRYPSIPEGCMLFLRRIASCVNATETVWFLCADDYNGTRQSAWTWNEFEKMGLEAAEDEKEAAKLVAFWNSHLPFMYSVGGDYAYLGFRMSGPSFGSIVDGYDIELTTVSDVAPSFEDFLRLHSAAVTGDAGDTILGDYV